jgi:hypothetical protein
MFWFDLDNLSDNQFNLTGVTKVIVFIFLITKSYLKFVETWANLLSIFETDIQVS